MPLELVLCINVFIKKKFFTWSQLIDLIREFPYQWTDKADSPQPETRTFATRNSVGGNGHDNWSLLRLLPFIIEFKVPECEQLWHLLMDLKNIVEIVASSFHTDDKITYLDTKISEHRNRYIQVFPQAYLSRSTFSLNIIN